MMPRERRLRARLPKRPRKIEHGEDEAETFGGVEQGKRLRSLTA